MKLVVPSETLPEAVPKTNVPRPAELIRRPLAVSRNVPANLSVNPASVADQVRSTATVKEFPETPSNIGTVAFSVAVRFGDTLNGSAESWTNPEEASISNVPAQSSDRVMETKRSEEH